MGDSWNIKNFEDLLASTLESGDKIVGKNISALTAPGENYGSIMLRVDVSIKNEQTGKEKTLNTVAKLIPESEKIKQIFDTPVTYRNEYIFYAQIVPLLDKLLKSRGIPGGADFIAPFYGGRLNLDGSEVVNSDAVILMENLKVAGYATGQKTKGFNKAICKLVLDALAKFHAAGLVLRHLEPHTYKEKLEPYYTFYAPEEEMYDQVLVKVIQELGNNGFTSKEIETVSMFKKMVVDKPTVNETWGTITHNDSWTNNFLVKYEENHPTNVVMVDFQVCDHNSPLTDVMFFLFTSLQQDIFEETLDELLEYYYKQLLGYLKTMGLDTQPFTKVSFEEEVKKTVRNFEYTHTLWMLLPIMHEAFNSVEDTHLASADWSKVHVQKIMQITRACLTRGWLSE